MSDRSCDLAARHCKPCEGGVPPAAIERMTRINPPRILGI